MKEKQGEERNGAGPPARHPKPLVTLTPLEQVCSFQSSGGRHCREEKLVKPERAARVMQRFPFHTQTANKQIKQTMKSTRLPAFSHRPQAGGLTFAVVWLFGLSSGKNPPEDEPCLWLPLHAGSRCCCLPRSRSLGVSGG